MARRRRRKEDPLAKIVAAVAVLAVLSIAVLPIEKLTGLLGKLVIVAIVILIAVFLWQEIRRRIDKKRFNTALSKLRRSKQEEYLINFINRFGFESDKKKGWSYRNRNFEWDRINDLKKILSETGITSNEKDIFALLRFYIQKKEENLTRASVHAGLQKLDNLTGVEFEKLLYRLFEAMGYKTEWVGKSGDQGGDLIANNGNERILVQAKRYKDWSTGNSAVQQAVGAMKYYDCNKAIVVTTSYFTKEAIALAKANGTELIAKERLQELLLNHLRESWA